MESIISTGSVVRGWIGVEPQDVTPEIAESFGLSRKDGALIAAVVQGGPADRAGLRPGDILTGVNGESIPDTTALLNSIAQIKPGTEAKVTVSRKGKPVELTIVVGKRPPPSVAMCRCPPRPRTSSRSRRPILNAVKVAADVPPFSLRAPSERQAAPPESDDTRIRRAPWHASSATGNLSRQPITAHSVGSHAMAQPFRA